jgi:hypothetical protein
MTYQTLFLNAAIVSGLVILSRFVQTVWQTVIACVLLVLGVLLSGQLSLALFLNISVCGAVMILSRRAEKNLQIVCGAVLLVLGLILSHFI